MNFCPSPEIPILRGPVPLSHMLMRQFVQSGNHVIDATCGNGYDTLLLAGLVGPGGRVWAFDIQDKAMSATSDRLAQAGLLEYVNLIQAGHETIANHCSGKFSAVIFNLGYLPGGDRTLVTRAESTLAALDQSFEILLPCGIIAISIYPGHEGGGFEQTAIEERLKQLPLNDYHVWRMGQMNVPDTAPYFILIQKAP